MIVKKSLTVITGLIETMAISSIVFNWSSMDYMLTSEGYFASGCNVTNVTSSKKNSGSFICHSQQYILNLIYTLALFIATVATLGAGLIFDRFGTRFLRNLSTVVFMGSCCAVAFSTTETAWILFPALICLGCSGPFFYLTNVQTSNLFPKLRGTIINLLNGAGNASLAVTTLMKYAYDQGVSLKAIFIFLAFLGVLLILRTYFLLPKILIPYDVPENFNYGVTVECQAKQEESPENQPLVQEEQTLDAGINSKNTPSTVSLKSSVFSSIMILGTLSYALQSLRFAFYAEAFDSWLTYLLPHNSALVSFNISAFGYIQLSSLVLAPLNGAVYDLLYHYFQNRGALSFRQAKTKSLSVLCLICSSSTIIYSIFTLIDVIDLQYVSYIFVTMSDTFQSANISLLIIQLFPMAQFGTLYGISGVCTAIIMTMQYPLFYVGVHYFDGNFLVVNIIALLFSVATLAHPSNLYRKSRQEDKMEN